MSAENRSRVAFAPTMVTEFVVWARSQGYESVPPKGHHEVLRLVGNGQVLPYYRRDGRTYITIHDAGADLFYEWEREKRRQGKHAHRMMRMAKKRAVREAAAKGAP